MANKWSRELVLREILARDGASRPLRVGGEDGVGQALYQAGTRIFGSWSNALRAAGVAASRAQSHERWPPGRILSIIRGLARRGRPLRAGELKQRYGGCLIPAARRCFGSWNKAVIAAGVDPQRLLRSPAWTKERVLESILTRAFDDEPLGSRTVQPRTLAHAGAKFFGTWAAALAAAGLNDRVSHPTPELSAAPGASEGPRPSEAGGRTAVCDSSTGGGDVGNQARNKPDRQPRTYIWSSGSVLSAIQERAAAGLAMNAKAAYREDRALHSAAGRRYGNWSRALAAAGINTKSEPSREKASPSASLTIERS